MGVFTVTIEVGDPDGERYEPVEAVVDTGATNTVLPVAMLERLNVQPSEKSRFQLADSRRVELDVGRTWVRFDGRRQFTQVVFGPEDTKPILGAITLEEMVLAVDPVGKRLYQVDKYRL